MRSWRPRDAEAVHRICVATGDGGEPVHHILRDPDLVAYVFADPYLLLHPELAFVVEGRGAVLGYVVAALHTEEFYARWQLEWAPRFAASHPSARVVDGRNGDSQLRAFLHRPRLMLPANLDRYPSHLHINLVASARGQGMGKRLLHAVFQQLANAGSPGVQLGVNPGNTRAQALYQRTGMVRLPSDTRLEVRYGTPLNG